MTRQTNQMTKKEFLQLERREWNNTTIEFNEMIIIPTQKFHESGYRIFEVVAATNGKPLCLLTTGCTDSLSFQDVYDNYPKLTLDVLPKSGLIQLFSKEMLEASYALSSIFITEKENV